MKTYFSEIIPKLRSLSEELDKTSLLTNHHWIMVREDGEKQTYIFRPNNELLISRDGSVQKAKWDYLGNKSVLIDTESGSFLFKVAFYQKEALALKLDNKEEYALFYNEQISDERPVKQLVEFEHYLDKKFLKVEEAVEQKDHTIHDENKEEGGYEIDGYFYFLLFLIFIVIIISLFTN